MNSDSDTGWQLVGVPTIDLRVPEPHMREALGSAPHMREALGSAPSS